MTSRLYDNEDWQRLDAGDPSVPSFLSDPASGMPGPSDVGSLVFHPSEPAHDAASDYQRPGRHAAPSYKPLTPADPHSYGSASHSGASYGSHASYEPAYPSYDTTAYQPQYEPRYPAHADYAPLPEPRYDSHRQYGSLPPAQRTWDPLFDPWPPEQAGSAYLEPLPHEAAPQPRYVEPEGSWFREGRSALPSQPGPADISAGYGLLTAPTPSRNRNVGVAHTNEYDVALTGPLGLPELGFVHGQWYSLSGFDPKPIAVREALLADVDQASSIVQVTCWWMRENPYAPRAIDLATEMALAISEFLKTGSRALR